MAYHSYLVGDFLNLREMLEREHLLHTFPMEVWLPILKGVKCNTLEGLSNASPFFRNLLLSSRVLFLFPKVWLIISKKYHNETLSNDQNNVFKEQVVMDRNALIWPPLFSGIRKLRLVCRDLCEGVDTLYQNAGFHWTMDEFNEHGEQSRIRSLCQSTVQIHFNRQNMQLFDRHFKTTHIVADANGKEVSYRNPFIGRAIEFKILGNDVQQNLNQLYRILSKYGHHLWYCTVSIGDVFPSWISCYTVLKSVLELMPNLKVLDLGYIKMIQPPRLGDFVQELTDARSLSRLTISLQETQQLQSEIGMNPISTLGKLEFLKMNLTNCPRGIFHELLRSNGHVSMLRFYHIPISNEDYNLHNVALPNLRKLSFGVYTQHDFERIISPNVNWPLTKLNLLFGHLIFNEWHFLFNMLHEKWGGTLTHLMIKLAVPMVLEDLNGFSVDCPPLKLPHLTHLKMKIQNFTNFDFLLPLKNTLRVLKLFVFLTVIDESQLKMPDRIENGKHVNLMSVADRPLESNIWELFPKLDQIDFFRCVKFSTSFIMRETRWKMKRVEWERKKKRETSTL